MLLSML